MKPSASVTNLSKRLSWLVALIMALVPFQAFLTIWVSSWAGHYTLLRLWKEFLLLPLLAGVFYLLAVNGRLRQKLFGWWLTRLILIYFGLLLACGFVALEVHDVSAKALWYGLLVDNRFLVFFLAALVVAASHDWLGRNWQKILFAPAILVAAFAILQYTVLPYDFLKHFGYNQNTIYPYETINHNINHLRVMSTLRGANPLGAYLLVPICALAVLLFKQKRERRDKLLFGFGLLLALLFSFSRSAWIGAALGLMAAAWWSYKSGRAHKIVGWSLGAIVVVAAVLGLVLRNNLSFEDAILHTDNNSQAKVSSNQGHESAAKAAIKDIYHQPFGGGVGSAGPQSVYNNKPGRIAENYFLQIGQEAGLLGMALFIAICVLLGRQLYARRADPLALALLASFIGLSLVNLLSHAWSDDTLAYVWWGLAGIALAPTLKTTAKSKNI